MQLLSYKTTTDVPTTEVNGCFSHFGRYEYEAVRYQSRRWLTGMNSVCEAGRDLHNSDSEADRVEWCSSEKKEKMSRINIAQSGGGVVIIR